MNYITLSDLDKQGTKSMAPIWAINIADQSRIGRAGEIVIAVSKPNGQGQPDLLHMPQTWLPQEVTRIIPRKRLLNSTEFRKAVNDNLLGLISEETAAKLMRQSGAKEEQSRLAAMQKHIQDAGAARTISDSTAIISRADGIVDDDDEDTSDRNKTFVIDTNEKKSVAQLAANGVEDDEPGISPSFKMWADRLNLGKDMEAKNAIKSRSRFSKAELSFLDRTLNQKFEQARKMIKANLAK